MRSRNMQILIFLLLLTIHISGIISLSIMIKEPFKITIADYYFARYFIYKKICNQTKDKRYCKISIDYATKAYESNYKEILYAETLSNIYLNIYKRTKKVKYLDAAKLVCNKNEKFSYEKHRNYICISECFKAENNLDAALIYINKAEKLIPYNHVIQNLKKELLNVREKNRNQKS